MIHMLDESITTAIKVVNFAGSRSVWLCLLASVAVRYRNLCISATQSHCTRRNFFFSTTETVWRMVALAYPWLCRAHTFNATTCCASGQEKVRAWRVCANWDQFAAKTCAGLCYQETKAQRFSTMPGVIEALAIIHCDIVMQRKIVVINS